MHRTQHDQRTRTRYVDLVCRRSVCPTRVRLLRERSATKTALIWRVSLFCDERREAASPQRDKSPPRVLSEVRSCVWKF